MPDEKILIIEDDSSLLRGLKDNFAFEGYVFKHSANYHRVTQYWDLLTTPGKVILAIEVSISPAAFYSVFTKRAFVWVLSCG